MNDCPFIGTCDGRMCWCVTVDPPMKELNIVSRNNLTLPSSTEVTVRDALVIQTSDQHVCVDAKYDFSKIPPEFHHLVLGLLQNGETRKLVIHPPREGEKAI